MKKRKTVILGICAALLFTGCKNTEAENSGNTAAAETSAHAAESTVTLTEGKYSEEKLDGTWDEKNAVKIQCSGESIRADGDGVTVEENTVTIGRAGTYLLSGELTDGQLIVDTDDPDCVRLVFDGISLAAADTSPVYVKSGDVIVTLAEKTENTVSDGEEYAYEEGEEEPKAAIYAKDDLTFNGTGTLTVNGNYNNAIQCKDDLKFVTGTYKITAVNNGIVGKDSVSVKNGNFTVEAGGDGIKSTNTEETDKGYVILEDGSFDIRAEEDAIQSETLLRVNAGTFGITADSGLKSYVDLTVTGGTFELDTNGDGIHSSQNAEVDGGTVTIRSGDDGIHADQMLTVSGGTVDIQKSYEGLEGFEIVIDGGDIRVIAGDDGINAAGDNDSAADPEEDGGAIPDGADGAAPPADSKPQGQSPDMTGQEERQGQERGRTGDMPGGGMSGGRMAEEDQGALLTVNGGSVYVDAGGDGLDANGDIYITGGTITVLGPTDGGNGTLDYASECRITGGVFLGAGSAGMVQNPSEDSTQPVLIRTLEKPAEAGAVVTVTDSGGETVAEFTAEKTAQWFCVCTPDIEEGEEYTVSVGDDSAKITAEGAIS